MRATNDAKAIARGVARFLGGVILPTAVGAAIYVFFRSTGLTVFTWIESVALLEPVLGARRCLTGICLPEAILYSLPDGLWVFAVTSWMVLIWQRRPPWYWLSAGAILAIGGELGQAVDLVPGTYQHLDMLFYAAGFMLALPIRLTHEKTLLLPRRAIGHDRARIR